MPTGSLALRSRPGDVRHVGWSLGNYCNARCAHCYSWQVRQSPRMLTRADVDQILGELVRTGVRTANLGGNEPLFTDGPDPHRTLLPYIVERLAAAGITVGITTNGTTARWMARHEPDAFDHVSEWHLSVDSPFPAEHDANRGGNYFELVQRSIGEARRRGATMSLAYLAGRDRRAARPLHDPRDAAAPLHAVEQAALLPLPGIGTGPRDLAAAHLPERTLVDGRRRQPQGRIRATLTAVSVPTRPGPWSRLMVAAPG